MQFRDFSFSELLEACRTHDLETLSLAYGLSRGELETLDAAVRGPVAVERGTNVCPAGRPCETLYVVHSGAFKCYRHDTDGDDRIMRFLFAGEMMGLDSLYDGNHHTTCTALVASYVFRLPVSRLPEITRAVPGLQRELLRLAVKRIREDEEHMLLVTRKPAAARIATHFLHVNQRQRTHHSAAVIYLPMTRNDLASYLDLAPETLSRHLSQFERDGVIEIPDSRHVVLADMQRLADLAGFVPQG